MIRTERLLLRSWRPTDRDRFAEMNADAEVMEHFPSTLDRAASDGLADRAQQHLDEHGWGLWAVEAIGDESFVGFTGLAVPRFEAPFTPCVEVGWRLGVEHWGKGYATEAARAALSVAFGKLDLDEVVSFTAVGNTRSRQVMERLGMVEDTEFDHPALSDPDVEGHHLCRHVLYRLGERDWRTAG